MVSEIGKNKCVLFNFKMIYALQERRDSGNKIYSDYSESDWAERCHSLVNQLLSKNVLIICVRSFSWESFSKLGEGGRLF
jgi:hypothetical protein